MTHRYAASLLVTLLLSSAAATAEVTLVHAGELLAVPGEAPASNMTITG